MAAIAGVSRLDQGPANHDLATVLGAQAHRTPDGVSTWVERQVGLGHGALQVTPEAAFERQPVALGERWMLVVDGRIDNRDTLAKVLGVDTATLAVTSDGGLFGMAWGRWQAEFWRHVEGDFALAAWDRREQRLTLMRDRIGVRPLFYARSHRLLAFASEPEAMLGLDGISRRCDEDGLAYLLATGFDFDDFSRTLYRDVTRLQPGWRLEVEADGRVQLCRYWQPLTQSMPPTRDPREHIAEFREAFDAAVACRVRGVARPALLLSGGIDSGCVLASARRLRDDGSPLPLLPISLVETHEPVSSETANIQRLHAGSDGIRIPIEDLDGQAGFSDLLERYWHHAHPIDNSLSYATLSCFHARAAGCRVVIDGADGDVVTASTNRRAAQLFTSWRVLSAVREARMVSRVNTYQQGVSPMRILWQGVAANMQPDWLARHRYRRRVLQAQDSESWLDAGFSTRLRLRERRLDAALAARKLRRDDLRQERLAWIWWNPGFMRAMEGTDRTYAQYGLEAWHPWCDQRVVDLFMQLPDELLSRDGWTKWIVRAACAPELGDDIAWYSGKSHVGQHLGERLLAVAQPRVSELLVAAGERLSGVVDAGALGRLCDAWRADPTRCAQENGDSVLLLATLSGWIERHQLQAS
ncbi:MAG: hypothetical protein JSS52_09950 [Proteobacteria bacterium]|nr:hypothetical protein [Pseudomonadota bacterium]